ncbi:anthranilate phosphoribosyltransferase [Draconibacterium halophilum]|uniref:Anthranilate phosphoribosyltransferase n=1 Tax=Draconibacterium halophilum TaxID=2706887 RepID=A0A6C0RII7_9BACT|nr:anthranilate phosphoribosyltransferase [Draconibacterium halophilum]QIA09363.1 anthranilate phosphoribosyltransferase [Draconibacterium halophilum]
MKDILQYLFDGNTLTREEAKMALIEVGKGMHSDAEFASFLTVFKMRPLQSEELGGFRDAMAELSKKVDLSAYNAIDVVGTGGDGKNTFNISTISCFLIAGAGVNVTKHGNYAVTSTSGSSNVLEFLGYEFSNEIDKLKNDLDKGGFCFLHAPLFHPAMKHIAPVRRALKVQTFFNILGPMINPAEPKYQVLGVNNNENFEHYKTIYKTLDVNFAILNSVDGYDEISLTADTHYATKREDKLLAPAEFELPQIAPEKLFGGDSVEEAAKIFIDILKGNGTTEQNNVVIANAAVGLQVVFSDKTLTDCVEMARESLTSGNALKKLDAVTNKSF